MSAFLRALAWIAPRAALTRAHTLAALNAQRGYDAATVGRRGASFRGVLADSANGALGPALHKLRERSSDMVRNTWIGARAIDVLGGHVIGTGITVVWKHKRVQELWDEWCKSADIEGERDFNGSQLAAFRSMYERGDAGIRFVHRQRDGRRRVPLALQVVEGDWIATERDGVFDGRRSRLGVVVGEWGERVGYWLHAEHPGDYTLGSAATPSFVPRESFCHLYRALRAGQVRGAPFLAPVLMAARDYADLMDAMVVKTRMEACYGLIVNSSDPVKNIADATTRVDQAGRRIEGMSPGMIYRAGLGETVTAFSPSGNGQFDSVSLSALMGIASGGMLTYDQQTGDLRRANYTQSKVGRIEFNRLVEQLQWLTLVPMVMSRVTAKFVEIAILAGELRDTKAGYPCTYVMPATPPIDPLKDLKADILAVRAGRMAPQEFIAAWGRDWRKVVEETREFWDTVDASGLVLDIDPRRVTQAGTIQPEPQDDSAPSDDDADDDMKVSA